MDFLGLIKGKCMCKVTASGREIGLESDLASLKLIFKQVLAGLLKQSFNKSYTRLSSKKQKKIYIFVFYLATRKKNKSSGYKGPHRLQAERACRAMRK